MTRWFLLVCLTLGACQLPTREAYRDNVQTWIGRHSDDLVIAWGPPDRAIDLSDGGRLYEYDRQQQRVVPGPRYPDTVPVLTHDRFGRARVTYVTVFRERPGTIVLELQEPIPPGLDRRALSGPTSSFPITDRRSP